MGPTMSARLLHMSHIDTRPSSHLKERKSKRKKPRRDYQNKPYQYNSKNMRKKHNIKQPGLDVQRRKQ